MSLWIGNKEVGLSPSQISGYVRDIFVVRPSNIDVSEPYIYPFDEKSEVK